MAVLFLGSCKVKKILRKVYTIHKYITGSDWPMCHCAMAIEIIDIECVLLSFLSKNFVSTKWRIYKGILASPRLLRREFRAVARSAIWCDCFFLSSKVYRKIKIRDFTWKNGSLKLLNKGKRIL